MPTPLDVPPDCRQVNEVLSRVGEKWTMQVVVALLNQPRRFNELRREVKGISQQMLTRALKTGRHGRAQGLPYHTAAGRVHADRTRAIVVAACAAAGPMGTDASRHHSRQPLAI
jgi:hypothetical protein